MAKIEFEGLDDYRESVKKIRLGSAGICRYALYEGAAIVADAVRANIPDMPGDYNDLKDTMMLTPMQDEDGYIYTQIAFPGYDSRGVPNALKARVLESGSATRKKHPFIRTAINRVKPAAQFAIQKALDEKINEIMNEKG